jgi:DNA-binding response OmpR family regulator
MGTTIRAIVIDDDATIRAYVRALMKAEGWASDEAACAEDGLELIAAQVFDLVIVDHMMPGVSGMETARRLRALGFANPIILFSAYLSPDLEAQALELAVIPVSKVDTAALARVLRAAGEQLRVR